MFNRLNNLQQVNLLHYKFFFMNTVKNAALIECGKKEQSFLVSSTLTGVPLSVTKACFLEEGTKAIVAKRFPQLEITENFNDILQDEKIGLVMISAPSGQHWRLVGAALKANKQVQIV